MSKPALALALVSALVFCESACAHDPSAYGGLFRTRNWGANWLNADVGLFLGAAVALAINPADPDHLLLGTDSGLLVSRNAGRKWERESPDKLFGPVFGVTFLADGKRAICATPAGVHRFDGNQWTVAAAPREAAPARAIRSGADASRLYLIGRRDLFASADHGGTWRRVDHALTGEPEFTELAVTRLQPEVLYAVVDATLMVSHDQGLHWELRQPAGEGQRVEGLSLDPGVQGRLWIASADRVYRSDDGGLRWTAVGSPLPEAGTSVRGVAADPEAKILLAVTHRGLYRSADGGIQWRLLEDNLPVHLEARPLLNDSTTSGTVYAGFALMPYGEIWRIALEGGNLLSRIDPVSLAGGLAFLLLLILLGIVGTRWLMRRAAADTFHTSRS